MTARCLPGDGPQGTSNLLEVEGERFGWPQQDHAGDGRDVEAFGDQRTIRDDLHIAGSEPLDQFAPFFGWCIAIDVPRSNPACFGKTALPRGCG